MWNLQISLGWVTRNFCVVTLESLFLCRSGLYKEATQLIVCSVLSSGFYELKESYSLPPMNCLEHSLADHMGLGSFVI